MPASGLETAWNHFLRPSVALYAVLKLWIEKERVSFTEGFFCFWPFLLLKGIIQSFETSKGKGLPLGNITSQLFANIYLNELDQFVKHKLKIKFYARYCDDFVILSESESYLDQTLVLIDGFLQTKLKLVLHPNKIEIRKWHQGIDFLGYVSFPQYRLLRKKTKKRMFEKIKAKHQLFLKGEISQEKFEQTLKSYNGHLKHCASLKIKGQINELLSFSNNV